MKTGAPLCARGRVRALRGLPRALCERGLRGPLLAAWLLGRPRGRGGGNGEGSGNAGGPRDGGLRAPARR